MVTHSPRQLEEQVGQLEIKGVSRKQGCVVCLTLWGKLSQCIQSSLTLPCIAFILTHGTWKLIKSPIVTVQVWKWFGEWNTFSIYLIPSLNSANYASLPDCTFAERIRFPHLDENTQACRWRQMVIWGKEDYERDRKREGVGLVNHLSVAVVSLASTLTRGLVFFGAADED